MARSTRLSCKPSVWLGDGAMLVLVVMAFWVTHPALAHGSVLSFQQGDGGSFSTTDATGISSSSGNLGSQLLMSPDAGGVRALLRFPDIFGAASGQMPLGADILSATLTLTTENNLTVDSVAAHQILTNWAENTVTWANFGASPGGQAGVDYVASASDAIIPNAISTPFTWDITAVVQAWSSGADNLGILFIASTNDGVALHTDDATTLSVRPKLDVTFIIIPEPATFLLLAGLMATLLLRRHVTA